jgi:Na+-driven multidrug efflux pump
MVIGKSFPSLILNLSRQFILLIPLLLILSRFFQLTGVLISFPLADGLAAMLTIVWLTLEVRKLDHEIS